MTVGYECSACWGPNGSIGHVTFDFNADTGMFSKIGAYKVGEFRKAIAVGDMRMQMTEAFEIYNSMKKYPDDYNLVTYNC